MRPQSVYKGLGYLFQPLSTIKRLVRSYFMSEIKVPETRNRRSAEDNLLKSENIFSVVVIVLV